MAAEFDSDAVVKQVTENLRTRFPEFSEADIRAVVAQEVDALKSKKVTDYVAVLSERAARKRLKASK